MAVRELLEKKHGLTGVFCKTFSNTTQKFFPLCTLTESKIDLLKGSSIIDLVEAIEDKKSKKP